MQKSRELETAISAAEEAGKILLEMMGSSKIVTIENESLKGKADFTTDSDVEAENAIIEIIEKQFPDHNILGEQTGKREKSSKSTWIVDSLDGTKNYFRKLPIFTVSIALAVQKEIALGVVFDPSTKRLYHAGKGKGAFLNGERMTVSKTKSLDRATVFLDSGNLAKINPEHLKRIGERIFRIRNFGTGTLGLCYVAQGGYDAYIGASKYTTIMDIAAGMVIAQEAGAEITCRQGEKPDLFKSREIIASNGLLHKGLLEIFR